MKWVRAGRGALLVGLALALAAGCAREGGVGGDAGGNAAVARDLWRVPRRDRGAPDALVYPGKRTCTGGRRILPPPIPVKRERPFPCGTACRQVAFGAYPYANYDVAGDHLVYQGEDERGIFHIYLVDLRTDREWLVKKSHARSAGQGCGDATTDGKRIAYACYVRPGSDDQPVFETTLQLYDPRTREERDLRCWLGAIGKSPLRGPDNLSLGPGGVAVTVGWNRLRYPRARFFRFSDGRFLTLSPDLSWADDIHMDGTRVVWTDTSRAGVDIMLHDLSTGRRTNLSRNPHVQFGARIHGTRVVWTDNRNDPRSALSSRNSDIYLHDIASGETRPVSTHPALQYSPDVEGRYVVWTDWRNNRTRSGKPQPTPSRSGDFTNSDIYLKDLVTGREYQLTSFPGFEGFPRIDRGRVFFLMDAGAYRKTRVFMIDLRAWLEAKDRR